MIIQMILKNCQKNDTAGPNFTKNLIVGYGKNIIRIINLNIYLKSKCTRKVKETS